MRIGIYNRRLATLGGGERHSLALAHFLSRSHSVSLFSDPALDLNAVRRAVHARFELALDDVAIEGIAASDAQRGDFTSAYDLFINASHGDFVFPRSRHSTLLVFFPHAPPVGPVANAEARVRYAVGRLINYLPAPLYSGLIRDETLHTRLQNLISPRFLKTVQHYSAIWANSRFTQRWIARYWQQPSELLYPPVAVETFAVDEAALRKQPQILSVGRFFAGHHNKKHLLLIRAFREMVDAGLLGWTLHLAGGTNEEAQHQDYLAQIRAAASGYPIAIHPDLTFKELAQLYQSSALYWHASGADEDEDAAPQKVEHFGLTTVEAMAAGCVPVVIGKGGQPEIVEHGQSGFLWQTPSELKRQTQQLIADPSLRREMSLVASARAQHFDQRHFEEQAALLVEKIVGGGDRDWR